ncbi:MAG: RNA-binding protein [Solirubrobacterales bacterium]|nr:RNA-binding protein [Solirubrobacterales bacterium]
MGRMSEPVRVDKWLWAARLTKTRALAAEAVAGGRVSVNGLRVKPSKEVRVGDELELSLGPVRVELRILDTTKNRGPAKVAVTLYEESEASVARRAAFAAERRMAQAPIPGRGGRPTKRDRRRYESDRQSRLQDD